MSTNDFSLPVFSNPFQGAGLYAFQRNKMLVGDPTALIIRFKHQQSTRRAVAKQPSRFLRRRLSARRTCLGSLTPTNSAPRLTLVRFFSFSTLIFATSGEFNSDSRAGHPYIGVRRSPTSQPSRYATAFARRRVGCNCRPLNARAELPRPSRWSSIHCAELHSERQRREPDQCGNLSRRRSLDGIAAQRWNRRCHHQPAGHLCSPAQAIRRAATSGWQPSLKTARVISVWAPAPPISTATPRVS